MGALYDEICQVRSFHRGFRVDGDDDDDVVQVLLAAAAAVVAGVEIGDFGLHCDGEFDLVHALLGSGPCRGVHGRVRSHQLSASPASSSRFFPVTSHWKRNGSCWTTYGVAGSAGFPCLGEVVDCSGWQWYLDPRARHWSTGVEGDRAGLRS